MKQGSEIGTSSDTGNSREKTVAVLNEKNCFLLRITDFCDIDARKLMDVYYESNYENTDYFCPDEHDKEVAVRIVEAGFIGFLKDEFFKLNKATCWVIEENGIWISALRTCEVQTGLYYLEALETRPDCRKRGYGSSLLSSVIETMKEGGSFRLCDCVNKKNVASLKTHEKCGFRIVSEEGYDYLLKEADDCDYGLEICYHTNQSLRGKTI